MGDDDGKLSSLEHKFEELKSEMKTIMDADELRTDAVKWDRQEYHEQMYGIPGTPVKGLVRMVDEFEAELAAMKDKIRLVEKLEAKGLDLDGLLSDD